MHNTVERFSRIPTNFYYNNVNIVQIMTDVDVDGILSQVHAAGVKLID